MTEANEMVAIVFIPGILGSKLLRRNPDGKETVIWGKGSPTAKKLVLRSDDVDPTVTAKILDEYFLLWGFKREDVYGVFHNLLKNVMNTRGVYHGFAYDWRLDISKNAELLDKFLRKGDRFKNKVILLVAHSMGGVIAWEWQSKHYQGEKDSLNISRLILVGSPLKGACEMLRLVSKGYQPNPEASHFEQKAYEVLFKDLRPAAFTFPSVFQLLPSIPLKGRDACMPSAPRGTPGSDLPFQYFTFSSWKNDVGKALRKFTWKEFADKVGMKPDEYIKRFKMTLQQATALRRGLRLTKLNIPLRVFFTPNLRTMDKVEVAKGYTDIALTFVPALNGDGRVPWESAYNEDNLWNYMEKLNFFGERELTENHGNLLEDEKFIDYINTKFNTLIDAHIVQRAAEILLNKSKLFDLYMNEVGRTVSKSALRGPIGGEVNDIDFLVIDELNRRIRESRAQKKTLPPELTTYNSVRLSQENADKQKKSQPDLIIGFELVLAERDGIDDLNRIFARGRLGWELIKAGDPVAAIPELEDSEAQLHKLPLKIIDEPQVSKFMKTLYNNLGAAYFKVGACSKASINFNKSAGLGYDKAKKNLNVSCTEAATGKMVAIR